MSLFHFDATQVPTLGDRTPIPDGDYNIKAVEVERKPTKDDPSYSFLAFTFEVIDGPHAGYRIFENINLWNKNPTAVGIAAKTLSSICHATGVLVVEDPAQLLNRPMKAHVKTAPARPPYDASNKITSYGTYEGPIGGAGVGATAAPALARPVAAPAAPARPAAPMAPASAPSIPTAPAAPIPPPFAAPMTPSAAPAIPDAIPVVPEDETPVWARSK